MPRSVELWMVSHLALGMAFPAFIVLLVPSYVDGVTGSAAAAGLVMAVLNLPGVVGPLIGGLADRHRAHRLALVCGLAGMGVGFGLFASSADHSYLFPAYAVLLGLSLSAVSTVGPVFIVGAGLTLAAESRQMTFYSLALPTGQILGGAAVAVTADWRDTDQFWMAAAVMFAFVPIVAVAAREPERRVRAVLSARPQRQDAPERVASVRVRHVLWSTFGVIVLVHLLSSTTSHGINNQVSNIMPEVYGMSEEGVSTVIAVAGLLTIVMFVPAGRWVGRSGATPVYVFGNTLRLVGSAGMALVGWLASSATLLAVGFALVLYQSNPFCRIAQSSVAVRFAPVTAGVASGWLITAAAVGGTGGSLVGGVVAERYGFNAVSTMGAIAASGAVALSLLVLLPAARRRGDTDNERTEPGASAWQVG